MHQFSLSDEELPKRVARSLQAEFVRLGIDKNLSGCLNIVAELYGESSWKRLKARIGKWPASPLDHETDDMTVAARRSHHEFVLQKHGVPVEEVGAVIARLKPTSSRSPRRIENTSGRFTYLDLTSDKLRAFTHDEAQLFALIFSRELAYPVYSNELDWTSREGRLLMTTGPGARQALAIRLSELNAKTTIGPVILAASVMKFQGEPIIWADTLKEMERRSEGTVTLRSWAEGDYMPGGIPSDEGIQETMAFRYSAQQSFGYPIHRHEIKPGEIGLLVSEPGRPSYSARIAAINIEAFEHQMAKTVIASNPHALESIEKYKEAQIGLIKSCADLESDPEVEIEQLRTLVAGSLLWLAFHHPRGGEQLKARAVQMATAGGTACVTLSYSNQRLLTHLGSTYADTAFLNDLPTDDLQKVAASFAEIRRKEEG